MQEISNPYRTIRNKVNVECNKLHSIACRVERTRIADLGKTAEEILQVIRGALMTIADGLEDAAGKIHGPFVPSSPDSAKQYGVFLDDDRIGYIRVADHQICESGLRKVEARGSLLGLISAGISCRADRVTFSFDREAPRVLTWRPE